jgi:hypothetical protein
MRKISENPERILSGGLCSTCRTASTCMYLRCSSKPILQCEEFEAFSCEPKGQPVEPRTASVKGNPGDISKETPKYFGLCSNCKHTETCTFPKPAGGVWHCEEYE